MKNKRQLFRLSQKVLFFDEETEKFLIMKVTKNKNKTESHKEWYKTFGPWDLPGGHVDEGEDNLKESLTREIREETGIIIDNIIDDAYRFELMINKKNPNSCMTIIYLAKYSGAVILSEEHEKYEWLTKEEILKRKDIKPWISESVEIADKKMELENSLDSWHRCLADFDNYKKRQIENQKEFTKYAAEGVIHDMLPVLDNFHAATDHIPEGDADNPWVTGIMFIQQQMEKVFEEHGVTRIEIKKGDEFNPEIMEAIKNNDEKKLSENSKVKKIAQPGYKMGEKILRPARVVLK